MERIAGVEIEAAKRPQTSALSLSSAEPTEWEKWIATQLTILASARQAAIGSRDLRLYSKALREYRREDLQAAVGRLSKAPRREGETAMPTLGDVIQTVRDAKNERVRAEADLQRKWEWAAHKELCMNNAGVCPVCKREATVRARYGR
jgi:hypothetical protein